MCILNSIYIYLLISKHKKVQIFFFVSHNFYINRKKQKKQLLKPNCKQDCPMHLSLHLKIFKI